MIRTPTSRRTLAFLALGIFLSGSRVMAQAKEAEGLEQTYARLCGNGQTGETCTALRQALMAKLSGESAKAGTAGNAQSLPGQAAAGASAPQATAPYWGHYLDLIKDSVVVNMLGGESYYVRDYPFVIATYTWDVPGRVMSVSYLEDDGTATKVATLRWDEQRGVLMQTILSNGAETLRVPQADGSFVGESGILRKVERKLPSGLIEERTEVKSAKGWDLLWTYHLVKYSPEADALFRQMHANNVEVAKLWAQMPAQYRDPQFVRQIEEAEAARKKSNGRFLRAMVGAGLGLAAANAGGMDAAQTVGAAAKGAALMAPDSKVAQVAGASGDAILQNSGLGQSATAGTASGGSGTASYPTRPNALAGQPACAMMNEGNYRQVGVSGGTDVQLKTMCAQAFEYYTMYKRAIAQGYAEADANRTYAAHEQAAQNAIAFHANNRGQ